MFACAEQHLISGGIFPGHPYLKEGAAIIRELLKKGSIPRSTFYGLVDVDIGGKLLESKVFAFHPDYRNITFRSTVMKRFCEENPALWEGK
jgi:hypothetical protein